MFLNSADGTENSPETSVNSKQFTPRYTAIYSESKKILAVCLTLRLLMSYIYIYIYIYIYVTLEA